MCNNVQFTDIRPVCTVCIRMWAQLFFQNGPIIITLPFKLDAQCQGFHDYKYFIYTTGFNHRYSIIIFNYIL